MMKPIHYKLLGYFQLFISMVALSGGSQLVISPEGQAMGIPASSLAETPFSSFLFPGMMLIIFVGLGNLVGAYLSLNFKPAAGFVGIIVGIALIIWIIVQTLYLGFSSWLQLLFLLTGIVEMLMGTIIIRNLKAIKKRKA
jgi:hypothetical protein